MESKAVSESMSASTGLAPDLIIARIVANAVIEVEITSSSEPIPRAFNAISIASIPLPTPIPKSTPQAFAHCSSKCLTSFPKTYRPDSKTRLVACNIASRISGGSALKSFIKIIICPNNEKSEYCNN